MTHTDNILDDLSFRGLIYQMTDEDALKKALSEGPVSLYCGFDPTADSLHVGSLLPILILRRFQLAGHRPIAVVGGGTGMIGDPSGKSNERQLQTSDIVHGWTQSIRQQLERYLDFTGPAAAEVVNNYDWISKLDVISFLRDIGKHFSVPMMLGKDSVKSRLASGISFTEFSYMLLQSYDFLCLHKEKDCTLQVGGQDQWGNITAGTDLIRRVTGKNSYGITMPLVTKSDGTKFGKSEGGAVWLDSRKTSPYQFFQFWINTPDSSAMTYIKYFTFLSREEIESIEKEFLAAPEKRLAQRRLAEEVTTLIHGKEAVSSAERISQALFYGKIRELSENELADGFADVPSSQFAGHDSAVLVDALVSSGLVGSKRQAREDVKSGAVSINGEKCTDMERTLSSQDRLFGKYTVLRRGKKNYHLIKW